MLAPGLSLQMQQNCAIHDKKLVRMSVDFHRTGEEHTCSGPFFADLFEHKCSSKTVQYMTKNKC